MGADLIEVNFSEANLSEAILREANLRGANLSGADLNGCQTYGVSAWNLKVNQETKQSNLIITQPVEATITVDDIHVAQFIYLLVNYKNLRSVLNSVTKRGVLILGRLVAEALRFSAK